MRLSKKEETAIVTAFKKVFRSEEYKLYLFGSRTDDQKKGGDIDLLVVVNPEHKKHFIDAKSLIKVEIFKMLDEQKIDITIATQPEMENDVFLSSLPLLTQLSSN